MLQCKNRIATGLSHAFFLGFYVITSKFLIHKTANYIKGLDALEISKHSARAKSVRVERWKPASSSCRPCFFSVSILSLFLRRVVCGGTADVAKVSAAGAALCQSPVCPRDRIQSDRSRESRYFLCVNCSTCWAESGRTFAKSAPNNGERRNFKAGGWDLQGKCFESFFFSNQRYANFISSSE